MPHVLAGNPAYIVTPSDVRSGVIVDIVGSDCTINVDGTDLTLLASNVYLSAASANAAFVDGGFNALAGEPSTFVEYEGTLDAYLLSITPPPPGP